MSGKAKFHLLFSIGFLIAMSVISWLIIGNSSPFSRYFLYHTEIPNAWGTLNIIPGVISMAASGHGGNNIIFILAFVVQWFLIGLLLSKIISSFTDKPVEHKKLLD